MEKVLDYIRKNGMVQRGDRIIAGVSGGPDSVCLLFLLDKYKETLGISLEVVHMEHGIRGKESLEDAAFVENFCRKLAIPCHTYHRDIPKLAREWKCSGEEAGRRARYEAFEEVRSKNGGTKIAGAIRRRSGRRGPQPERSGRDGSLSSGPGKRAFRAFRHPSGTGKHHPSAALSDPGGDRRPSSERKPSLPNRCHQS